jgi:ATP-binding cassette subfamily C protein
MDRTTTSSAATMRAFAVLLARTLRWRIAAVVALSIALACAEGTGLVLLVPLLDAIGLTAHDAGASRLSEWVRAGFHLMNMEPGLLSVLIVFVAVSTAHALLYRATVLLQPSVEQSFGLALRERLYASIVGSDWSFFLTRRSSDLLHAVTVEMDRVTGSVYHVLAVLTGAAVSVVYVAIAFRLSPVLTVLVSLTGLGVLWVSGRRGGEASELGKRYSDADRRQFQTTSEFIAGLKLAKTLGAEERATELFSTHARARADAYLALLRAFARSKSALDIASAVLISALLFVAVRWMDLRGVGLLLLIFVFARIMPRVMSLLNSARTIASNLPSFDLVMKLIADGERHHDLVESEPRARLEFRHSVRLRNVSFGYGAQSGLVLENISLTIPAGRLTAIVGASGAGKSTLADILIGLLRPATGSVDVDDRALASADMSAWRRSIGYVPQDGFLLHDTIRANLRWAKPDASDEEIWQALERAAAAEFVAARPEKLDAVVGDRGVRLSGGERQRIALARALLTRPQLLVLDEATSALDPVNERLILDAIERLAGRVTTVIITHRLAAIRHADLVHVLDGGQLVESGTWPLLRSSGGQFARLLVAQGIEDAAVTAAQSA